MELSTTSTNWSRIEIPPVTICYCYSICFLVVTAFFNVGKCYLEIVFLVLWLYNILKIYRFMFSWCMFLMYPYFSTLYVERRDETSKIVKGNYFFSNIFFHLLCSFIRIYCINGFYKKKLSEINPVLFCNNLVISILICNIHTWKF